MQKLEDFIYNIRCFIQTKHIMSKKPRIIKTSWKKNFFDMKINLKKNRGYCDCERTCEHTTGDACAKTEKPFL